MTQGDSNSSAAGVAWDLNDLYSNVTDSKIDTDLKSAMEKAQAFEKKYRGKIATEGGPDADTLLASVQEYEQLLELMAKPAIYAMLVHAAKTDVEEHGALVAKTQEQYTAVNQHLIFFELEWLEVEDVAAEKLVNDPKLAKYKHYLKNARVYKPHTLSEPEEKILDKKAITGRSAFVRLFDETVSSMQFPYEENGETQMLSQQAILAKLYEPDRSVRQRAAEGTTKGLQEKARLMTFIMNNLVQDHKITCDIRQYDNPMQPRHLANEIKGEVVDALMTASERYHSTVQRYYKLKGKLLGIDQLYDYDRYAPIFEDLPKCDWKTGRQIVEESYSAFSPKAGNIVREFFDKKWIDAELRDGKRGGAFSHGCIPSAHPYILVNYTDKLRDVMTVAHELGHGIHQYLSRPVGYLQAHTPLTTAETASVFGEMLTFARLQEVYSEPKTRLAMLCSKIEDGFATVFRQIVLTRFEQSVHKARVEQGELKTSQINELWMKANQPMHGDVVIMSEGYAWWWEYIGHFIHVPFYCYAYSFGELLVLALYQKYKQEGESFVPKYLELLSSGGSDAPHVLLSKLGVDVNDPEFWELGLKLLDDMVSEAEKLAAEM